MSLLEEKTSRGLGSGLARTEFAPKSYGINAGNIGWNNSNIGALNNLYDPTSSLTLDEANKIALDAYAENPSIFTDGFEGGVNGATGTGFGTTLSNFGDNVSGLAKSAFSNVSAMDVLNLGMDYMNYGINKDRLKMEKAEAAQKLKESQLNMDLGVDDLRQKSGVQSSLSAGFGGGSSPYTDRLANYDKYYSGNKG